VWGKRLGQLKTTNLLNSMSPAFLEGVEWLAVLSDEGELASVWQK
jgi:hypothetical protein